MVHEKVVLKKHLNYHLLLGGWIIGSMLLLLLVSFFYTPYDPNEMNPSLRFLPPGPDHWLGTDNFGRDVWSRIIQGTQVTFFIGTLSVSIGMTGGIMIGAVAGFYGKWIDDILMRVIDALLAVPGILVALMFTTVLGPGMLNTALALGIMFVPHFARVTRGGFLQYREFDYVQAARAIGLTEHAIILRYILPAVFPTLMITVTNSFASAILAEAGLSYLGLGVQPPDPSWGRMLKEAQSYMQSAPWYAIAPGLFILLTVLGFNMLGDGMRTFLDPRRVR